MLKKFQETRLYRIIRSFLANECPIRAAGLTYYSMLALVPMLCILLFFAKTCGVDDFAREQINHHLDAMIANVENGQDEDIAKWFVSAGAASPEQLEKKRIAALEFGRTARSISDALFDRIDAFHIGTLGWVGFLLLIWTIISTLRTIEASFNRIWSIQKARSVPRSICMYLFLVCVMPILVAVAASIPCLGFLKEVIVSTVGSTWLTSWASDGVIWLLDSRILSFLIAFVSVTVNFAFIFWFMPNCRIRIRPAIFGGAITALLFGGWLKLCAILQVGIANSSALYGSFAFLPIVLAWFFMSWQIVLFGACLTRYLDLGAAFRN